MKILFLSRCPPYPLHLGDRLILWHLARELHQRGHTLDLLAFAQLESDLREQAHYAAYFHQLHVLPEPTRTPLDYLRRVWLPATRFPKISLATWSPAMAQHLQQWLPTQAYDVVHVFGSVQVYEYAELIRPYAPMLITPYESFSLYLTREISHSGSMVARARRIIAQQFERFMFTPYAYTVVVAPPDQAALQRLNPALNVQVIPNGIDTEYFDGRSGLPVAPNLLFVGNYEYPPNIEAALTLAKTILPAVRQQIPNVELYLVGNAPPVEIQALANDHIHVTGRVADIRPYHQQASAFVCPLQVGAGIKNKVLEALAMGVPVVATPLSMDGIAVQQGESALIAEVPQMAAVIVRLLQDQALQQQLGTNGQMLIRERYSWRGVAAQYETLYEYLTKS